MLGVEGSQWEGPSLDLRMGAAAFKTKGQHREPPPPHPVCRRCLDRNHINWGSPGTPSREGPL